MKQNHDSDLRVRVIKNFSDITVLKFLKHNPLSSGYQILRYLHETFNIIFSPGTIYHEIYSLERKALIKSDGDANCRMYSLTPKGTETLEAMLDEGKEMRELIDYIFSKTK